VYIEKQRERIKMKKNPLERFVVVGTINEIGQVNKYNESESKLATAIYRANLQDADAAKTEKQKIVFTDEGIAKAQAENDEMIRKLFG
jgi:hypothetical protein